MGETALDSAVTYQEWLDDRHPLMERFRRRAGATLKHCQNVAHLCDVVAANADGVNRAQLKIAAMYHDVGKILNPSYFCENQNGENNPHDELPPAISFQIISRHVSDSAALLAQYRFPFDVIDMVLQHHGSKVVDYFYFMASRDDGDVNEDDYRYPWPAPQTSEAAILMIADVIEAAARSKHDVGKLPPDPEGRTAFVAEMIRKLEDDGQLDHVPLGIVRMARELIPVELASMFHTRIDYPDAEDAEAKKKKGRAKLPMEESR